ncbi:hypothetical protein [Thermomonospora cellulosilytica]|uniref:Uncharacterized protein n=1 Tax=Thermomonospora cellulosilytica TaxID=1411118 RepID=A0A7W3MU93_9ACTN|nr:hypothetical protein [Thermomonospora cellulosilytica]MBA9001990.1 hypothetical protein [Thermomonospora cellulosilytica]
MPTHDVDRLLAELAAVTAERDKLAAELKEIRRGVPPFGGVLYEVIGRAKEGADEHELVRQIERRLLHPLAAELREARARVETLQTRLIRAKRGRW